MAVKLEQLTNTFNSGLLKDDGSENADSDDEDDDDNNDDDELPSNINNSSFYKTSEFYDSLRSRFFQMISEQ